MFALRAATVADLSVVLPRTRALNDHEGIAISDAGSGHIVRSWKTGIEAQAVSVAAAERLFATGGEDRIIHRWDDSGKELVHWTAHSAVTALAFGANGGVLRKRRRGAQRFDSPEYRQSIELRAAQLRSDREIYRGRPALREHPGQRPLCRQ